MISREQFDAAHRANMRAIRYYDLSKGALGLTGIGLLGTGILFKVEGLTIPTGVVGGVTVAMFAASERLFQLGERNSVIGTNTFIEALHGLAQRNSNDQQNNSL